MTIGRHGNSVRRLGHAGDDGQSRSLAGGAGRHRDVVGRLADEGGHLLNLAKDEHLAPKALVTPTGETYAMVAPTITKNDFILVDSQDKPDEWMWAIRKDTGCRSRFRPLWKTAAPPGMSSSGTGLPDKTQLYPFKKTSYQGIPPDSWFKTSVKAMKYF